MAKYRIKFKHTVEQTFSDIIEAETEDKALYMFDESPFDYLEFDEPEDEQGLNIEIIETIKID
ncbi:hypothetical protein FACS189426_06280 [Bacteroidia bacterium]|nr:hypothetical protein FACS189426_06280 [Bacteroidia bacterium]GHV71217.1 hypothetical protein FACS189420_5490 [Bacteroidia bacterium]